MRSSLKLLLSLLVIATVTSSCKREPYYSCVCTYVRKDTSTFKVTDSLEIYRLGRMTSREAYPACKAYDVPTDTTVSCIVEERK